MKKYIITLFSTLLFLTSCSTNNEQKNYNNKNLTNSKDNFNNEMFYHFITYATDDEILQFASISLDMFKNSNSDLSIKDINKEDGAKLLQIVSNVLIDKNRKAVKLDFEKFSKDFFLIENNLSKNKNTNEKEDIKFFREVKKLPKDSASNLIRISMFINIKNKFDNFTKQQSSK